MSFGDRQIGGQECSSDILNKRKYFLQFSSSAGTAVKKYSADASGLIPMFDKKILVTPFFEFRIIIQVMLIASSLDCRMKMNGIFLVQVVWCQVHSAAEPGLAGRLLEIPEICMN